MTPRAAPPNVTFWTMLGIAAALYGAWTLFLLRRSHDIGPPARAIEATGLEAPTIFASGLCEFHWHSGCPVTSDLFFRAYAAAHGKKPVTVLVCCGALRQRCTVHAP